MTPPTSLPTRILPGDPAPAPTERGHTKRGHTEGAPASLRRGVRPAAPLAAATLVLTVSAVLASAAAPPDAVQGQWQRLMYVHVPTAWTAYLAFTGVLAVSLVQLCRPQRAAALRPWARAAAEVGVVATGVTLLAGSLWGHGVWGVWWAWDARLVSTAAMFAVYLAYLGLVWLGESGDRSGRRAAWVGALGFAVVPVVHFSVLWWTTLHQRATVLAPPTQAPPIDPRMALALALSLLATTAAALLGVLLRARAAGPAPARAA